MRCNVCNHCLFSFRFKIEMAKEQNIYDETTESTETTGTTITILLKRHLNNQTTETNVTAIFMDNYVQGERCKEVSRTHVKHQPTEQGQTTTPGTPCPTLYDKCVGSLTCPANHITLKMQDTGPTVYSPYPRRLQRLTICRCNYKGSTFSSVILRPWVLVRSGAWTLDLPHRSLALYQLSYPGGGSHYN